VVLISAPVSELAAALEAVDERFKHSVGTMPWGPVEFPLRATQSVHPSSNCCKIPTCCPALAGNSSGIVWMKGLSTVAMVYGTPASVTRGTANMGVDSSDMVDRGFPSLLGSVLGTTTDNWGTGGIELGVSDPFR